MPKLLEQDPVDEADRILGEHFYGREAAVPVRAARQARPARPARPKPTHYKIVCISLYTEDIERLEALVAELKRRGHPRASKSAVIRHALDALDLDKLPREA